MHEINAFDLDTLSNNKMGKCYLIIRPLYKAIYELMLVILMSDRHELSNYTSNCLKLFIALITLNYTKTDCCFY